MGIKIRECHKGNENFLHFFADSGLSNNNRSVNSLHITEDVHIIWNIQFWNDELYLKFESLHFAGLGTFCYVWTNNELLPSKAC